MIEIRPTIQALKELRNAGLLSHADVAIYDDAKRADDGRTKLATLAKLDLSNLDVVLLNDIRTSIKGGRFPDTHRSSSQAAQQTIFELRDRRGAAWRGAGLLSDADEILWVLFVMPHDEFHHQAPQKLKRMRTNRNLGPSSGDKELLRLDRDQIDKSRNRIELLRALIDALKTAQSQQFPAPLDLKRIPGLTGTEIYVSIEALPIYADDWNVTEAHKSHGMLTLEIELHNISNKNRDWVLRNCLPFLQPDQSMIESIWKKSLSNLILLPHSKLVQLLSLDEARLPSNPPNSVSTPSHLHYTAKAELTEAYVEGKAVRAVCGVWWVPTGDECTHNDLPICEECESERPFAEAISQTLQR